MSLTFPSQIPHYYHQSIWSEDLLWALLQSDQSGTCYALSWTISSQCDQGSINPYCSFRVAGSSGSACAASPLKGSRCIYRVPCINKGPWSPAQTHTHFLCPHIHSRQSSALPHCHGQSVTETGLWNNPSSVLRATETPQDNSWGLFPAAGVIRGGRGTTCLQQLLCFYKDEGISMNLLMEYLSLLSSGSWACFGKTGLKLVVKVSVPPGSLLMKVKRAKYCNLPFVSCSLMLMMVLLKHWHQKMMSLTPFTVSQITRVLLYCLFLQLDIMAGEFTPEKISYFLLLLHSAVVVK